MSKVAFVTGAAMGIGKAIALRLAKDGFNVVVSDLIKEETAANEVVNDIIKLGGQAVFIPADVTDAESLGAAVRQARQKFNGFDVMVNNAGVGYPKPFEEITKDDLMGLFNINVNGVVFGIQEATKIFKELGHGGRIINACSLTGQIGLPGFGAYVASKFAVRGVTQTAAQELAHLGITVNAYCPGTIETEKVAGLLGSVIQDPSKDSGSYIPVMKRTGRPEEIAGLVSFLAGEDSSYITGQSIIVDGGIIFR